MWTQPNSLYRYCSPSHSEFEFYYLPLPKFHQKRLRQSYDRFVDAYQFMSDLLRDRILLMEEEVEGNVYPYEWPVDPEIQNHLIKRLPKELVFELGAVILGWMRAEDEEAEVFLMRIAEHLKQNAMT